MSKDFSKIHVIANFCNKASSGLIVLICIPFYLKYLGIEAYGITSFYMLLNFLLVPIEAAISATVSRQMAHFTVTDKTGVQAADLFRSLEAVYWLICIIVGICISCSSSFIANHWVQPSLISLQEVTQTVFIMGICLSFQWPNSLYYSGLMGLQKQVLLNSVQIFFAFLKSIGGVLVLAFINQSLYAFFIWQLGITIIHTMTLAFLLWKYMPKDRGFLQAHFQGELLIQSWPFISQSFLLALTNTGILSLDKLFVSKYASLEVYGYYMLAYNLSNGLYFIIQPFFYSLFPRFSELVAQKKFTDLYKLYNNYSQIIVVLVVSLGILCACFAKELVFIWIRNQQTAEQVGPFFCIFILGTVGNGLMNMPIALQYSFGWLKPMIWQNIFTLAVLFPIVFLAYQKFGILAIASLWLVHNLCSIVVLVPIVHRKLLPSIVDHWAREVYLLPLVPSLLLNILAICFLPKIESLWRLMTILGCLAILSLSCSFCLTSIFRDWARKKFIKVH
jgi:O-antigen/teichoic acid export membrane protein